MNDLVRPIRVLLLLGAAVAAVASGCDRPAPLPDVPLGPEADADGHTAPTPQTAALNLAVAEALKLDDPTDFGNAERGLIAREDDVVVNGPEGTPIWQTSAYAFEEAEAPPSVNPSLWRQAQLNNRHGLYRVTDGVYQVRGYDLSNMTLIEGKAGWIVVDPLTVRETAAAAWALVGRELGTRPISAVIFTHSHVDHFGG
ncbi:MAG: MBL fold metallo-hydrolase, partial [Myxococcota bacterium]